MTLVRSVSSPRPNHPRPWFQPYDLPPYFDFINSVQQEVEQRLLQRLTQEPTAGQPAISCSTRVPVADRLPDTLSVEAGTDGAVPVAEGPSGRRHSEEG